jgi:hypothetical protein
LPLSLASEKVQVEASDGVLGTYRLQRRIEALGFSVTITDKAA